MSRAQLGNCSFISDISAIHGGQMRRSNLPHKLSLAEGDPAQFETIHSAPGGRI